MEVNKFYINDIPVSLSKTDKFKTINFQILFMNEFNKELATSLSLLSRLLNNSTKKYNSKKKLVNKLYDLYDASVSVFSYPSYKTSFTVFSLEIVNENNLSDKTLMDEAFAFLKEIIYNPNISNDSFNEKEFFEEKRKLKEAIEKIYDNKNRYAIKKLIKNMCPNEITSVSSLGDLDDLEKITPSTIVKTYEYIMKTSNVSIYCVGDVSEERLKEVLKKFKFKQNSKDKFQIVSREEKSIERIKQVKEEQNINQSILCMGYRTGFNSHNDDYFAGLVFCEMFGGLYTSDLFRVVREEHSLAYSIVSQIIPDVKMMVVNAGIDGKNSDLVIELVGKELDKYKKGEISLEQMEIAKLTLINDLKETEDDPKSYVSYMLKNYLLDTSFTIEDNIKKVLEIKQRDIIKIAQEINLDTIFLLTNRGSENGKENL